jgi:hypothetical protein
MVWALWSVWREGDALIVTPLDSTTGPGSISWPPAYRTAPYRGAVSPDDIRDDWQKSVTIDDPGAYTRPFTITWHPLLLPNDELMEYICNEE